MKRKSRYTSIFLISRFVKFVLAAVVNYHIFIFNVAGSPGIGISYDDKQTYDYTFDYDRNLKGRIIGGNVANKDDYPWYGTPAKNWWCGAALIRPDVMITAAHCVGYFDGGVKIGHTNYYDNSYTDIIPIQSYHVHPSYDNTTFVNDIALIKLVRPSKIPIPFLRWNANRRFPSPNATVRVMGFGYENYPDGPTSDNLLQVDVRVVDFDLCFESYRDYTGDGEVLTKGRMICAGNWGVGGKDACLGDSGGPLISQAQIFNPFFNRTVTINTLVGIVSWGDECGLAYRPGVYTQVATYDSWIRTTMCYITSVKCPARRRAPIKVPVSVPVTVPPPRVPSAIRPSVSDIDRKSKTLTDVLIAKSAIRSTFFVAGDTMNKNASTRTSGITTNNTANTTSAQSTAKDKKTP